MHRILGFAVALLMWVPAVASAGVIGGDVFSVTPSSTSVDGGALGVWAAGRVGEHGYIGGELSIGSYVTPDDAGVSYHVLGGVESRLSDRVAVLADLGAGVTQQVAFRIAIFPGDETGLETEGWLPSSAARVQLVAKLGKVGRSMVGLSLDGEARAGFRDDEVTTGMGVGLGVVLSR